MTTTPARSTVSAFSAAAAADDERVSRSSRRTSTCALTVVIKSFLILACIAPS